MRIYENGIYRDMTAEEIAELEKLATEMPAPEPTPEERIAALEAENKLLKEQVSAQSDQMDFYEDCIAEMATVVYA